MIIERYVFENEMGEEEAFTTFNPREAQQVARTNRWLCVAQKFEFADSEPVWDYRPQKKKEDEKNGTVLETCES